MTQVSELPFIAPLKCRGSFHESMWEDPLWVAEEKIDGSRHMLYMFMNGATGFYSYREFPRIEKAASVRQFARRYDGITGIILDGEVKKIGSKFLNETTRIMNMSTENAIRAQAEGGLLTYIAFDILYLNGQELLNFRYEDRRKVLEELIFRLQNPYLSIVTQYTLNKKAAYDDVLSRGGEGLILKHRYSRYGQEWVKRKKFADVTVFVIGFNQGSAGKKYGSTLGALRLGVFYQGKVVEIGECSGMDDQMRDNIWQNQSTYLWKCLDVRTQEITSRYRLREPRFYRWRDDVNLYECTYESVAYAIAEQYGQIKKI